MNAAVKTIGPFDVLLDYEERSLNHVPGRPESVEAPGHWRGIGFRLGQRRLASSFDEVVEILTLPNVSPVPGALPWMLGVTTVRGTLLPVVDLKQFLEGARTLVHERQRVLVMRQAGGNVAVLIDELFGQRIFNDSHAVTMDEFLSEGRYGHFVTQTYQLGGHTWGVFNMALLARTPEFRQAVA